MDKAANRVVDRAAVEILKPLITIRLPYRDLKVSSVSTFQQLQARVPELELREKVVEWASKEGVFFDEVWTVPSTKVYYYGRFLVAQATGISQEKEDKVEVKEFGEQEVKEFNGQEDLIPNIKEYEQYVQREIYGQKDIKILKKAYDAGLPVLLEGPAGIGKSAMVRAFCAFYKIPYFRVNLNGGTTVDDLVGQWIPYNGGFVWSDGVLTRMMRKGGILVVDEINAATPEVLFILHSVLDDEKILVLVQKDGEVVKAHPKFLLVATMNPADYAGVKELNEALKDRFLIQIKLNADTEVEKRLLTDQRILRLAELLREV